MNTFDLISPTALILAAILWVAVWMDIREHRIPNALIIVLLCVGLTAQIFQQGPVGLFSALDTVWNVIAEIDQQVFRCDGFRLPANRHR